MADDLLGHGHKMHSRFCFAKRLKPAFFFFEKEPKRKDRTCCSQAGLFLQPVNCDIGLMMLVLIHDLIFGHQSLNYEGFYWPVQSF